MKVSNNSDINALPRALYVVGRSHGKVVKVIR